MKRHSSRPISRNVDCTALQDHCPDCQRKLRIIQVIRRPVELIDEVIQMNRRDKRCRPDCPGKRPVFFAPRDIRIVLPDRVYGLEVTMHIGEQHLARGVALAQITRDLNARGMTLDQRHTGRIFRDFLALTSLARGDEAQIQAKLRAQGGMVLMCDGVQFDERSPVLYLVWDAVSGTPLFGERKVFRGKDDLVPLLMRVKQMNVPVIGAVTDKETGLVPAIQEVFPDVPYQYCQNHFLKNCAKPLKKDTKDLGTSIRGRAEAVRKIEKQVTCCCSSSEHSEESSSDPDIKTESDQQTDSENSKELTESGLVEELCELVRVNSKVNGKAPLDPKELKQHERLEDIRNFVDDVKKKHRNSKNKKTQK